MGPRFRNTTRVYFKLNYQKPRIVSKGMIMATIKIKEGYFYRIIKDDNKVVNVFEHEVIGLITPLAEVMYE